MWPSNQKPIVCAHRQPWPAHHSLIYSAIPVPAHCLHDLAVSNKARRISSFSTQGASDVLSDGCMDVYIKYTAEDTCMCLWICFLMVRVRVHLIPLKLYIQFTARGADIYSMSGKSCVWDFSRSVSNCLSWLLQCELLYNCVWELCLAVSVAVLFWVSGVFFSASSWTYMHLCIWPPSSASSWTIRYLSYHRSQGQQMHDFVPDLFLAVWTTGSLRVDVWRFPGLCSRWERRVLGMSAANHRGYRGCRSSHQSKSATARLRM